MGSRRLELLEMIGDGLMGLLLRADDIPAKTESQQMAKSILQLREQGRAGEVTEEMMEQADPRTMAAYTPLDMSLDARMDRARQLGFDPDEKAYHGSAHDPERFAFEEFERPVYTSDNPAVSNTYTHGEDSAMFDLLVNQRDGGLDVDVGGASYSAISPKYRDRQSGEKISDYFESIDPESENYQHQFQGQFEVGPVVSTDTIANAMLDEAQTRARIRNVLDRGPHSPRAHPIGGYGRSRSFEEYKATDAAVREWERSMQDAARQPSTDQITYDEGGLLRSRFARFDPEFAHLKNLTAAVPVGLIPFIMQYLEDVEREQAN